MLISNGILRTSSSYSLTSEHIYFKSFLQQTLYNVDFNQQGNWKYKMPWPWYFILYWMNGNIVYHYWKPSKFPSWQQWKRGNLARKCFTMAILYCIFFCSFDSILEKQIKCFQFWHQFRFERLKCPTLLITWKYMQTVIHIRKTNETL